ncbi:hypothetical protein D1007_47128 [Hordeum vulgare]|nr:hypothetical protein D1007_47128 [Hordeum vulgare]
MEFNSSGFMFLGRGWKSFALAQGLQEGHVLHFKLYGAAMLFEDAFGRASCRLDCCMEGDNSGSGNASDGNGNSPSGGSRGNSDSNGSLCAHV